MTDHSFIVGTIKYSEISRNHYEKGSIKKAEAFTFELSELMKEYGIVKIDVCFDTFKYLQYIQKENTV